MFTEWLTQQFLPILTDFLRDGVAIFPPTMAFVYIVGRMLNICKKDLGKNIIATIVNFGITYFYVSLYINYDSTKELIWLIINKGSIGIILYVLIGFKLFGRIDNLLDKKIANDVVRKKK